MKDEAVITKRRICWPDPDATCLQGGCGYCNLSPYRSLTTIRAYARTAGVLRHRGRGQEDALSAFNYGLQHDFFNVDAK